jgi:thiol-disulfide isomerase/thioredoxin
MSTLRLSVVLLILLVLLGLVGCSSTSVYRAATNAPKMRTVATIGDKPLPIVTGEPGETLTATAEPPVEHRSRVDSDGRISGRVVDEQGEPVEGARVRLAVSSAPGGRVVRAMTDSAGGFTLRGLRPGTSYTVIAEWKDGQGVVTGRSTVQAPDSDVRVALNAAETEPRAATSSPRVNPVSRRSAPDEEGADLVASPVNDEDLPPAPEAEIIAPASRRKLQVEPDAVAGGSFATSRSGGWRPLDRSQPALADPDAGSNARLLPQGDSEPALAPSPRRRADLPVESPVPGDDGPNPLPPALEPGEASLLPGPARPNDAVVDGLVAPVQQTTVLAQTDEPAPLPELPPGALVASPPPPSPLADLPAAEGLMPPAPSGPVASNDAPAFLPPPVESAGPEPAKSSPAPLPFPEPLQAQSGPGTDPPDAASRPRPKWRDLVASQVAPPPPDRAVRASPKEPETYCRFDSKHRRIEDFRLPDLEGRLVRFQDFDTDLVLLDFWGSWCQPCLRSVPHLVDLQKRLGGKQLQVIGIACERDETPAAERVPAVAKAVKKLGINYPILVSSTDGSCPVQKALHVQTYPTLILVDRQGRVLWQEQGATRVTMARLDRMISIATKPAEARRRY